MKEEKKPEPQSEVTAETSAEDSNKTEESGQQKEATEPKEEEKPERIQVQLIQFDKGFFAYELD